MSNVSIILGKTFFPKIKLKYLLKCKIKKKFNYYWSRISKRFFKSHRNTKIPLPKKIQIDEIINTSEEPIRMFSQALLLPARRHFYSQGSCKRLNAIACTHCVLLATRSKFLTFASACAITSETRFV